jgi:cbb3-type cytochrome oxidase cytochrome c subunit
MKNTFFFVLFISAIVALFAFAFSFSQDQDLDGKQIFIDAKCNNCHTVTSMEITSKKDDATDLSNASTVGDTTLMKSYLLKEAKINEQEHKIKFKGSEGELDALVNWLVTLKNESEG